MRTGSPELWDVAGSLGIVPTPPDDHLAGLLAVWLATPLEPGCVSAGGLLWVAAPDPRVWCSECIADRFGAQRQCVYCSRRLRLGRGAVLLFEVGDNTRVLARCHATCQQRARKR